MGEPVLSRFRAEIRKVKGMAHFCAVSFSPFCLDEVRLKNLFKNFFEKSIDIFKKSDIIDNVKRESK